MIVNVQDLPDSARLPLVLALRYQALAAMSKNAGQEKPIGILHGLLAHDFTRFVSTAIAQGLIPKGTSTGVEDSVTALEKAADLLWSIGLAWLQHGIMDGSWVPGELDLTIRPEKNPILNAKLKYQGKGFVSGLHSA